MAVLWKETYYGKRTRFTIMWKIIKEGEIIRYNSATWTDDYVGIYIDQRRRCKTCGKYELDSQVSYVIEPEE